jgi:transcriptional regulator with XRE-family HTH domain
MSTTIALNKAREQLEMTQKELAEKLGGSPGTVSSWETGKSTPSKKNQENLKETLKTVAERLAAAGIGGALATGAWWLTQAAINDPEPTTGKTPRIKVGGCVVELNLTYPPCLQNTKKLKLLF